MVSQIQIFFSRANVYLMNFIAGSATYYVILSKKLPLFQNVLIKIFAGIILLALVVMKHVIPTHINTFLQNGKYIFLGNF